MVYRAWSSHLVALTFRRDKTEQFEHRLQRNC